MYQNTYLPITSLPKAPVTLSGLCTIKYFRWQDVLTWPVIDPLTGIIAAGITLKPGTYLYYADAVDSDRSFQEQQKDNPAGDYFDISIKATLRGSNAANIVTLQKMKQHQWGVIAEDRNGVTRLIGNQDSGADFSHNYSSGTINTSRKTEITFSWQHDLTAPIYTATAFDIIIGGLHLSAGCIQFIERFRVGDAGAPMTAGDTLYINNLIKNKRALVLVDGIALPVDDFSGDIDWTGSVQRRIEKADSSNTINFVGSVVNQEIVELYAVT
jgi:hypothetical protein